ncbi:phage tail protein [Citrobacter freundii]|uniref:phage tail protein n=1 Tax=Citrobacter freundii TaxID=546 RepID=UPI003879741C
MATKYLALLTNIGAAKLAKATALGTKVEITQLAVGDGNGVLPTPNPAQTALVHERRRAPLNMLTVDPANVSQIIAEQVIPEDVGGWWIREIGLFDKDGDMVAIANCAETYKPQLQEGSGRVQVIRVILIVSSTEAVTLKIDPAVVLATRQYVDSQLRAHEQSRNHPDASTTEKGFVQLSSSVTSDSESQAATPKAVKIAMDNASARLAKDRNLSDLTNTALARQNLELGDSSTRNVGTTAGTVASGDDDRITGAMQKSQNGGDIPDVAKFLQNLGLDTALAGKQAKDDTLTNLSGKTVAQLLTYLTLGPIANASDIAAGSANKLIDAYGLNSYFPSRRFGTSGYIRIPNQPGGLILQWGPIPVIPAGGHVTVSYGFAFPEAYLVVIPIAGSSSGAANSVLSGGAGDPKLSFQVFNSLPGVTDGTGTGAYIALGF